MAGRDFIRIELSERAVALVKAAGEMPQKALRAVARALDEENELTIGHIRKDYASFPRQRAATMLGLRVQSGDYRRKLNRAKAVVVGQCVVSGIGSRLKYAAIHEFGGKTQPHVIRAKNGKALAFRIGQRLVFARQVKHPGSEIPARAPIQRGIGDRIKFYGESVSAGIIENWEVKS